MPDFFNFLRDPPKNGKITFLGTPCILSLSTLTTLHKKSFPRLCQYLLWMDNEWSLQDGGLQSILIIHFWYLYIYPLHCFPNPIYDKKFAIVGIVFIEYLNILYCTELFQFPTFIDKRRETENRILVFRISSTSIIYKGILPKDAVYVSIYNKSIQDIVMFRHSVFRLKMFRNDEIFTTTWNKYYTNK